MKHRIGTKLECELPQGYDDRTRIAAMFGSIIIVHPDFPPCKLENGKLIPIEWIPSDNQSC